MKRVALLGASGSIGQQAIEIIRERGDVLSLVTVNKNVDFIIKAKEIVKIESVCVCNEEVAEEWMGALKRDFSSDKIYIGEEGMLQALRECEYDVCLNALVGEAGVVPSLEVIRKGKTLLLANKEALVVAGEILMNERQKNGCTIIPVDSEHTALLQILNEKPEFVRKVTITCSGGPFHGKKRAELENVSPEMALQHPVWKMGAKITIDSATLMNKGFELIEAYWLFNIPPDKLDVIVHPQAFIHALVHYVDGNIKAVMFPPDMRIPIRFALSYPERWFAPCQDTPLPTYLQFFPVDHETFPTIGLAMEAIKRKGNAGAILHFANNALQKLFLNGKIKFTEFLDLLVEVFHTVPHVLCPSLDDLLHLTPSSIRAILCEKLNLPVADNEM